MANREVTLLRDCKATLIPAGDEIILSGGEQITITQTLGGSVTVRNAMGMYRIDGNDLDALGGDVVEQVRTSSQASTESAENFDEECVWQALRACFDPEIPVNIVDLGLIYDLKIDSADSGLHNVDVKMTLTARGCGMGPVIAADAKSKIESLAAVEAVDVQIVWDPQWTPHMISPEGRKVLGLD